MKRRRQFRKRGTSRKRWRREGGACWVAGPHSKGAFPCDDVYIDRETGRWMEIRTTMERHFDMPFGVDSLREVSRLPGTKGPWRELDRAGRAERRR